MPNVIRWLVAHGYSDQEILQQAYVNSEDGTVVETYEFMGRTFRIPGAQLSYTWRLSGEQSEFLGYTVQKATAEQDSTAIEAWFTPEIPVSGGPATFGGLPGMILVVSVDDGETQYSATEDSMNPIAEGVIVKPTEGDGVTREEYRKIVAEKLEELRSSRGRIRR